MESISVADAKAHLSDILSRIEQGGEMVITRRGRPIARLSPVNGIRKPIDFKSIDALRARQPISKISSVELVRQVRDERY
jgi:prevent-host-death family protein